ncbi:Ribosomal protein S12 methylthiotransferase RimO [BD1-7 clade bacterium]|uniref:Ribosomal protein S12 methylthiotransferase RimO n=1 Tax=BD1-7 clade bacterium TaxID=2029982 RepID=A0A5S9P9K6_9GAMM|nr:Ribosomal protein S12 methylthiotransferase RimO [BD1-7 clade bacterium]
MTAAKELYSYRKYWAECLTPAPQLPMSREEMDQLGWDSCDVIIVCGDAYVDHPSFGMAVIGRVLEAQGFRVGIIAQPAWQDKSDFMKLGKPNLFFGVSAGNMDSMINRYTADLKIRKDDAYTPGGKGGARPDRAVLSYSQRCREAYKDVPIVIGGIEASLRRIAHYDYWSDKVRRSALIDAKADILVYGNAERAIVEIAHRIANGDTCDKIRDIRGTAFSLKSVPKNWQVIDSTSLDTPGIIEQHANPYEMKEELEQPPTGSNDTAPSSEVQVVTLMDPKKIAADKHLLNLTDKAVVRLPAFESVKSDTVLYAHASRVFHQETNPGNARALVQKHGDREVWMNPPPMPLETDEMDWVFEMPYTRLPHTSYGDATIPAYDMIKFSVNIMRGCFGGCSFCSITEHEGRIIQNRSKDSILREIENIRDKTPGFTGIISDLGGPTANMWRMACIDKKTESSCRRLSCVWPNICKNLQTDQMPLVDLYRDARDIEGVKRVFIASGLRYDLAVRTPEYVKELVTHHVGGYLKIAPEHTEEGPLSKMMKPGMGTYDAFKKMFEKFSKEAGKEQYLIPYFIAAHPGTSDEDMMNLALWLKENGFRADQVQTFYPSPMANATTMYHTQLNPLKKVGRETVETAKGHKARRLHKAFLRYHAPENWDTLREALRRMGRADLIGNSKKHLIPRENHRTTAGRHQRFLSQHTGLPPRETGASNHKKRPSKQRKR